MKTRTSKKAILLRSILLLPLLAAVLYGFSETQVIAIQKEPISTQETTSQNPNYFSNNIELGRPTAEDFKRWQNKSNYAIWVHGKPSDNSELKKYNPSDFTYYSLSFVYKNARSERFPQPYQLWLYTQKEFEETFVKDSIHITILINKMGQLLFEGQLVKIKTLPFRLAVFDHYFSEEERGQRIKASIVTDHEAPIQVINEVRAILKEYGVTYTHLTNRNPIPLPSQQGGITPREMSEYNALAKKYNAIPIEKRIIPLEDLKILETIYRRMSPLEKENAQPFPECPADPKTSNQDEKERADTIINEIIENQEIYDDLSTDKNDIKKISILNP